LVLDVILLRQQFLRALLTLRLLTIVLWPKKLIKNNRLSEKSIEYQEIDYQQQDDKWKKQNGTENENGDFECPFSYQKDFAKDTLSILPLLQTARDNGYPPMSYFL